MVAIVARLKIAATTTTPPGLSLAAGNMSSGIRGSQGPKTKIRKRIHGVMFAAFGSG